MKKLLFLMGFFCLGANAQVMYKYPKGQSGYKGGVQKLESDLAKILKDSKASACENENEAIIIKVMIDENGSIKTVKEEDETAVNNNKCAYEMAKSALKHTEGWQPAYHNGKKRKAVYSFLFHPHSLLNDIPFKKEELKPAVFPKGLEKFSNNFNSCFDVRKYGSNSNFKMLINFEINTQGYPQFILIEPPVENKEFMSDIVKCLHSAGKWENATYKGTPITSQPFNFPINFTFK